MKHLITNLATKFIEEHWDEIDLKKVEITGTKEEYLKEISNFYIACWVISEVMSWGCKINYHKQYEVETESASTHYGVIKIEDTYFMMTDDWIYVEVKPKFKTVIYFE